MSLRRFHIAPGALDGPRVTFDREEARHIARALRLRAGDLVWAVDGQGREYRIRLERVTPRDVVGTVLGAESRAAESPLAITLAQGIAKSDKMASIIRAATELGVARIVPLVTERTVVKLDAARAGDRTRRWQRVVTEAAKQTGRAVIPAVEPPRAFVSFVSEDSAEPLRLCCWEGERRPVGAVLDLVPAGLTRVSVVIGPEGGLSPAEVRLAASRGFTIAGLGPRILRTETAGPAVIAVLQIRFGDLGI